MVRSKIIHFLILLLLPCGLYAQNELGVLKGVVVDSLDQPLESASVGLLQAKDSSAFNSGLTSKEGRFSITEIPDGKYILIISYLGYQSVIREEEIGEKKREQDLGKIIMKSSSVDLQEITIQDLAPSLIIRGDTLDFNASSFKTAPNAVVEELLKKIPGIEVTPEGDIKSEGEDISQILVDGKPFFGNDPKLATKNLPADIIDRVQIFDKRSDQAEFTGMDDGNEKKTINLKVKKDRNRGVFGQVEAGAGTKDRYETRANLFKFKDQQQISFIGNGNNTNQRNYSFRGVGPGGGNSGNVTSWSGGINYKDNWGEKMEVSGNYFYNNNNRKDDRVTETQYVLPDTSYFRNERQHSINKTENHRFDFRIDYTIDSLNSILFTPSIDYSVNENSRTSTYNSEGQKRQPINEGTTAFSQSTESPNFNGSLLYRRRFDKRGRTLSLQLNGGTGYNHADGLNLQETVIFEGGEPERDSINQRFFQQRDNQSWGTRLTYTEPLSDTRTLELHVGHNDNLNKSRKETFNQDVFTGKYDELDTAFTDAFRNNYSSDDAGFNIQTKEENFDYTLGFNVRKNKLDNYNVTGDSSLFQNTMNYYPVARFNYNFSQTKRLQIQYRGTTGQPSIQQLQPVPDNTESLREQVGNPDLKPYFTHSLQMNFRNYDRESRKMLFIRTNMSTSANGIVNATEYGKGGKQFIHYENASGHYNVNGTVTAGFPLGGTNNMINSSSSASYNQNPSFINGDKNSAKSMNLSQRLSLNFSHEEVLDFRVSGNVSYNHVKYSLQESQNTEHFNFGGSLDFNLYLPGNFEIKTDFRYSGSSGLAAGFNRNITMWSASIAKYIFKDQKGMIKLEGHDLLNKQESISRNITAEYIRDVRTNVVPQYFMLSFTYFLKQFPGGGEGERGDRGGRRGGGRPAMMMRSGYR